MMAQIAPYQFLEISVLSAQDLPQISKSVQAYAVAWLHPDRKLTTQVDQEGHTNPTWNEKFVFRVDDHFLNSDKSVIMVEIYSESWLRPVLIGTVVVNVSNLLPTNRKPKLRFVALPIRRPSGRPQGILNIGVTLLNSTLRSMPLYSELSSSTVGYSTVGYHDRMESRKNKKKVTEEDREKQSSLESVESEDSSLLTLQRCRSEKNDSAVNDYAYHGNAQHYGYDEQDSEVGVRKRGFFKDDSLISYVGPSQPVGATAIAKRLYTTPAARTAESSTIDGWSQNSGTDGMRAKMEKWRTELAPAFEGYGDEGRRLASPRLTSPRVGKTRRRGALRDGSCFGTVFGFEISITCARGNQRRKNGGGKVGLTTASSKLTYDDSYIDN